MKIEKFYEMQNFAVNFFTAVNSKFGQTITLSVNMMNYDEEENKVPIIQFIGLSRYKHDLTEDIIGILGDRFLNFNFEAHDDPDDGTVLVLASKK